jgi:hypothetical protein
METRTQPVPGYYVWEIPGKPIAVHLHLDVVDRLLAEVMRGFGAVPKRGAEVGGLLLGVVEPGEQAIVRIEDYEAVDCDYKRGPSYLFSDGMAALENACARWTPDDSRPVYAVGYFRSHTRDGFALAPEDIELLDQFFPQSSNVALLVRPYGTKVSSAGFFFREEGEFQKSTPLEFPFRSRELTGEKAPPRRSMIDRRGRERGFRPAIGAALSRPEYAPPDADVDTYPDVQAGFAEADFSSAEYLEEPEQRPRPTIPWWPQPGPLPAVTTPSRSRVRSWVWIPLSFIFLLIGLLLGFETALSMIPKMSGNAARDFALGLAVARSDENLSVRWDREAPAIRDAQRGTLDIEDGKLAKSVDLDAAQLHNGSVIYRNSSDDVSFRLTVYPRARLSVTETMEWKR